MTCRANYHTHIARCMHAFGDVADYVREARRAGLRTLGISDHAPFPDRRWSSVRMPSDDMGDYVGEIAEARDGNPDMEILSGFEVEYVPEYENYIRDELLGRLGVDYLMQGEHYLPGPNGRWLSVYGVDCSGERMRGYLRQIIAGMESGLFAFVAHPDLFANTAVRWDDNARAAARDLFEAAESLAIPLELNSSGLRRPPVRDPYDGTERAPYPYLPFWQLASEYDIRVVFSSDAHEPESVARGLDEVATIAHRLGLEPAPEGFIRRRVRRPSAGAFSPEPTPAH